MSGSALFLKGPLRCLKLACPSPFLLDIALGLVSYVVPFFFLSLSIFEE